MISARYAGPTVVILSCALVPTIVHTYCGYVVKDGRSARLISPSLSGLQSHDTGRSPAWVERTFESQDWIERRYTSGALGSTLLLFVARSYDPKRLYHHPELGILHGIDFRDAGIRHFPQRPHVPVRVLTGAAGASSHLAMYSLLSGGTFVENPYAFQLQRAWWNLFIGREAMTLFLVHDPSFPPGQALERSPGTSLLFDAIDSFMGRRPETQRPF